jgi:hypothetical protein
VQQPTPPGWYPYPARLGTGSRAWRGARVVAGVLIVFGGCLPGCGSDEEQPRKTVTIVQPSTGTTGTTTPPTTTAAPARAGLAPYRARLYSAEVPLGWTRTREQTGSTLRTTSEWEDPSHPRRYLVIDTSEYEDYTPREKAESVRAQVAHHPSYQEIAFGPERVGSREGWKWVFRLSGDQRADYFVSDCNTTFAVLGSTSPRDFRRYERLFRSVAETVSPSCPDVGPPPDDPQPLPDPAPNPDSDEADFCQTRRCIPNFYEGQGSIVQCADGSWSHSGGRPGACSYHGGVRG